VTKEFLRELGVPFSVRDLNVDREARDAFLRRGFRLPPVVVVGDQAVEGFDPPRIEAMLQDAGLL
jgi:glutaredoxin